MEHKHNIRTKMFHHLKINRFEQDTQVCLISLHSIHFLRTVPAVFSGTRT
jgi:hypothetical protein